MKKIITFLFCFGIFSSVFAQYQDRNPRNNDQRSVYDNRDNGRRYDDAYRFSVRERDEIVASIDRDYNRRIESVRHKWFMNPYDKRRLISSLEAERSAKISGVYARFSDRRNR